MTSPTRDVFQLELEKRGVVQSEQGLVNIWHGTQAEYDAIAVKDYDTLYIIVEA